MAPRNEPSADRPPPGPRLFSRLSQVSKKSFRSHSSSFEADDERSDSSGRMSRTSSSLNGRGHAPGVTPPAPPPKYPGEDTRPTSSKELSGWYAYAFAAEVYVICGESFRTWPP
jgi:MFS transporter, UMF1 family